MNQRNPKAIKQAIVSIVGLLLLLAASLVNGQKWEPVSESQQQNPGWAEVVCDPGEGWQRCEMNALGQLSGYVVFSRDVFQTNFPGTVTLNRVRQTQSTASQVVSGNSYSFADAGGYWNVTPQNLRVAGGVNSPIPASWPTNNCPSGGSEFIYCIHGPVGADITIHLSMPTQVTVRSGPSFKQLDQTAGNRP